MIQKKNLKFKRNAKRISAITLAAIMGLSPSILISDPVYGAEKTTSGKLLSAASEKTTSESLLSTTSENTDADQTNSDTSEESDQLLQNDGDYQASPKTGAPGGGSSTSVSWSGASTITSATTESNKTYTSTSADENAVLVNTSSGTKVTLENPTVEKSGGTSASDNYSFYGINSAIMCKGGGETTITGGTVNTTSAGANGIFSYGANSGSTNATGDGTTVNISDTVITTTAQGSGGIMTTYGGTTNASNLTITTEGGSSAPIRTDRGGGWVTVDGGTYTSNGQGSPAIYSTADVNVSNATLVSNKSEGVCIEGNGSIELTNCDLTARNTSKNGNAQFYDTIMIYQSMSGDATGTGSVYTMTGGSLTSKKGHVFHVTNTSATITLNGVTITNEDSDNILMSVANDGWSGNSNTATVNASNQTLTGDIVVSSEASTKSSSASSLTLTLSDSSTLTGKIDDGEESNNFKSVKVTLNEGCVWALTGNSYVSSISGDGKVNYGSYSLYVNGTAYTASNPYSGVGSTSESTDSKTATAITLNKESLSLNVGDSETLSVTPTPSTATLSSVTWSSSDESVATVNNGLVTAKAAGTATITAASGDLKASCAVTVTKASEDPDPDPDPESDTEISSGLYGDQAPVEDSSKSEAGVSYYIKEMVKGQSYVFGTGSFTSSDAKTVVVNKKTGAASAKKAGSAVLTDSTDSSNLKKYTVNVYEPVLSASKMSLVVGKDDSTLTISNKDSSMPLSSDLPITWISDNNSVLAVTGDTEASDGKASATITAIAKGRAKVSAWIGGKSYSTTVTVTDIASSLTEEDEEDSYSLELNAGQTFNPKYSNGFKASKASWYEQDGSDWKEMTLEKNVWQNDYLKIAKAGRITAVKEGEISLKGVDSNNKTVYLNVTVKAIPVKTDLYINVGKSTDLKHSFVKNSGVTWTTDDSSIVSLTNTDKASVKITGLKTGLAVLTCTYNGMTYETNVFVEDPSLTTDEKLIQPKANAYSYTLNKTVKNGESYQITQPDVRQIVNWKSSNKKVAFVDENGIIYVLADKGNANISGKVNGKTVTIKVTATN